MSLFDGQAESGKRAPKKAKSVLKAKHRSDNQALLDERGELILEDTSNAFLLCSCSMAPDYHSFPHEPHLDEIATFELQYHGKQKI
jgi:hypothetical protein